MKKILVIDDSKTIRTLCEWLYKGLDEELLTAASIAEANEVIAEKSPDLIVLDYTMPDGDSYEYCKALKSNPSTASTPILFLGGKYANVDEAKARSHGADDIIIKPFRSMDFLDKANALLAGGVTASVGADAQSIDVEMGADLGLPGLKTPSATTARPTIKPSSSGLLAAPPPIAPAGAPRRFNFPVSGLGSTPAAPESHETPANRLSVSTPAAAPTGSATPKTPLPSVSPALLQQQQATVDPELLKAEVQAAVREILPEILHSVLKKLIVTEVTPQIQHWVDARVEALIAKMVR